MQQYHYLVYDTETMHSQSGGTAVTAGQGEGATTESASNGNIRTSLYIVFVLLMV